MFCFMQYSNRHMKFILLLVLSVLGVLTIGPVVPFWGSMLVVGILAALVFPSGVGGFFGGGLGFGLAWTGMAIYICILSSSSLPGRMADLVGLGSGTMLVGITGILGFLLGGLSGLAGVLFRRMFIHSPKNVYRR